MAAACFVVAGCYLEHGEYRVKQGFSADDDLGILRAWTREYSPELETISRLQAKVSEVLQDSFVPSYLWSADESLAYFNKTVERAHWMPGTAVRRKVIDEGICAAKEQKIALSILHRGVAAFDSYHARRQSKGRRFEENYTLDTDDETARLLVSIYIAAESGTSTLGLDELKAAEYWAYPSRVHDDDQCMLSDKRLTSLLGEMQPLVHATNIKPNLFDVADWMVARTESPYDSHGTVRTLCTLLVRTGLKCSNVSDARVASVCVAMARMAEDADPWSVHCQDVTGICVEDVLSRVRAVHGAAVALPSLPTHNQPSCEDRVYLALEDLMEVYDDNCPLNTVREFVPEEDEVVAALTYLRDKKMKNVK